MQTNLLYSRRPSGEWILQEMGLTNQGISTTILHVPWLRLRETSVLTGLAIAGKGKGFPPKVMPAAKRAFPGVAQNMRGTVITFVMKRRLGADRPSPHVRRTWGFYISTWKKRGNDYEEDTFFDP